jgi:tol-pal system protein YbgF
VSGLLVPRGRRPGAVVGGLLLGTFLGLVGCGALREQVTKQGAELTELRASVEGLRGDLQALGRQVTALQASLDAADRRATAERAAGEARGRETQEIMAQRLATVERRAEELGDGVTGLEQSSAALAEQFARLEAGTVAAMSPPRARPGPRQAGPPISPEELFDRGMESYRAGELGQAVLDFEEFADKYPSHPLAPSAHFWIGEAYFRSRDFEQAANRYQKAIDLAATGDRTPDALLRLGLALQSLHREDRAREVWGRLVRDFPDSDAAVRARAVLRQPGRSVRPTEPR